MSEENHQKRRTVLGDLTNSRPSIGGLSLTTPNRNNAKQSLLNKQPQSSKTINTHQTIINNNNKQSKISLPPRKNQKLVGIGSNPQRKSSVFDDNENENENPGAQKKRKYSEFFGDQKNEFNINDSESRKLKAFSDEDFDFSSLNHKPKQVKFDEPIDTELEHEDSDNEIERYPPKTQDNLYTLEMINQEERHSPDYFKEMDPEKQQKFLSMLSKFKKRETLETEKENNGLIDTHDIDEKFSSSSSSSQIQQNIPKFNFMLGPSRLD